MRDFYIVVAADEKNGIGKDGTLPWHLKAELKYFKELTVHTEDELKENMLIMGRSTWESLPANVRPLPARRNVVLSTKSDYDAPGAELADSLDKAFMYANEQVEKVFVIGGQSLFEQSIIHPNLRGIYLTRIHETFDCDTFFPQIPSDFMPEISRGKGEEDGVSFEFLYYGRV